MTRNIAESAKRERNAAFAISLGGMASGNQNVLYTNG